MLLHNIRELCSEKGISLNQLEKAAGIGTNTVYRWAESPPGVDKVQKVAAVLGVTVDYLLNHNEP